MPASPEDIIQNILSDPEAVGKLKGLLGSFSGADSQPEEELNKEGDTANPFANPEMLMKLGQMWGKMSKTDNQNVNLIKALKPYLSEKRMQSAEQAIKILKLTELSSLFGDIDIFSLF